MGFFNLLGKTIKKADFMSSSPNLKIEGQPAYQTVFGGIVNISLVIITIIGIVYFGQELWVKREPLVVVSSMQVDSLGPFKFQVGGFMVFIGLEFPNHTYYTNERILTVTATHEVNRFLETGGQNYTITPIELGLCKNYYTQDQISSDVRVDIRNFYCIKPNQVNITGYWGAKKNDVVKYSIQKCVNTTLNNNHCFPEEIIDSYVQGGILSMFTTNSFLDMNSPDNPVVLKLQNLIASLNLNFTFSYFYKIKSLKFVDDKGFLLQDFKESYFPYFDNPIILYYGQRGKLIAEVWSLGEQLGQRMNRSYAKVQDVATRIGGLLKFFCTVSYIISNLWSEFEFFSDSIFNFHLRNQQNQAENGKEKTEKIKSLINKIKEDYNTKENKLINADRNNLRKENTVQNNPEEKQLEEGESVAKLNKLGIEPELKLRLPRSINNYVIRDDNNEKEENNINPNKNVNNNSINKDNINSCNNINEDNENNNKVPIEKKTYTWLQISTHKNNLLETFSENYSFYSKTRDFSLQMIGLIFCNSTLNKEILIKKQAYTNKINKLLSINYIFKKFYLLEIIVKKVFNQDEICNFQNNYVSKLLNIQNNFDCCDDSDALCIKYSKLSYIIM